MSRRSNAIEQKVRHFEVVTFDIDSRGLKFVYLYILYTHLCTMQKIDKIKVKRKEGETKTNTHVMINLLSVYYNDGDGV